MHQIRNDQSHRLRSATRKTASQHIRTIVQLLNALQDTKACFFTYGLFLSREELGYGDDGDSKVSLIYP